jgi:hypothetical protein
MKMIKLQDCFSILVCFPGEKSEKKDSPQKKLSRLQGRESFAKP